MPDHETASLVVSPAGLLGHEGHPLHRDHQLGELKACLPSDLSTVSPPHAWVHGPPGTGKSYCVRFFLADKAFPAGVIAPFVNCRERFTFLSVIEAILDHVQQLRPAQRSRERQLGVLRSALSDRRCLVILDEIDLLPAKDVADLVHHLCALPKTSLVCITASRQSLLDLPEATRSRMAPRQILFPRFRPEELAGIITRALERSLKPNAWQPQVVRPIADAAYGDARRAFALLRHAVLRADEAGAPIVTQEHLILSNFDNFHAREDELLASLSEHHCLLYDLVSVRGPIPAAALERAYREACGRQDLEPVATRTLNKYLIALCTRGLLERTRGAGTGGWVYQLRRSGEASAVGP